MLSCHIGWQQKRAIGPYTVQVAVHVRKNNKTEETANKNTHKKATTQKQTRNTQKQNKTYKRNTKDGQRCSKLINTAAYVLYPAQAIRETKANHKRWPRVGAEATKHVAETQDPPSQDPGDHNVKPKGHDRAPDSAKKHQVQVAAKRGNHQQQEPCRNVDIVNNWK